MYLGDTEAIVNRDPGGRAPLGIESLASGSGVGGQATFLGEFWVLGFLFSDGEGDLVTAADAWYRSAMKIPILFAVAGLLVSCGGGSGPTFVSGTLDGSRGALGFLPAQAEKGALFEYYQAKAPSKWRRNWASALDLTGVSWNDSRTATLISPSHVVMAAHYIRPPNVAAVFHDRSGKPHERYIVAVRSLPGDIAVGKLNLPLPPEVKHYRFASPAQARVGRPVMITDKTNTLSVHRIDAIASGQVRFGYIPELNPLYQRNLVVGDSGNPSFLVENGELVLLGTHTTGGAGAGPCYADPGVQATVRATMAELGN
jgi:hypothetical protein